MTAPDGGVAEAVVPLPAASAVERAARRGARGRAARLALIGPAFVACIAYVDPGNFATNISGGAKFGYLLLWVVLAANLMAMLIQYLSAKVGIATDRTFPELFRENYPRAASRGTRAVTRIARTTRRAVVPKERMGAC